MSTFVALNIEPESDSEDEIDDSKEIQIEEALKLYQNALKLHSQGPDFYPDAQDAYDALFKSEVFAYPESISLSKQIDLYEDVEDFNQLSGAVDVDSVDLPVSSAEEAPNTLQQILYLAYKNRGLFLLCQLEDRLRRFARTDKTDVEYEAQQKSIYNTVSTSLHYLVEAVDRDEDDLHLWRLISKLSYFLKSKRVARFCLEAVLDDDDAQRDEWPDSLGLEESYAAEQLITLLDELEDDVSIGQAAKHHGTKSRLLPSLRKQLDPLPFLTSLPAKYTKEEPLTGPKDDGPNQQEIVVPVRNWASVGKAILRQITNLARGVIEPLPGTAYAISLPERQASPGGVKAKQSLMIDTTAQPFTSAEAALPQANGETVGSEALEETSPTVMADQPRDSETASPTENRNNATQTNVEDPGKQPLTPADESTRTETGENMIASNDATEDPESLVSELPRTVSLPTRKRSSEAAGLPEATDLGRSKSKRIKARVSVNESAAEDLTQYYEDQLREYTQADQILFDFVGILLSKVDANHLGSLTKLKTTLAASSSDLSPREDTDEPLAVAIRDLKAALSSWSLEKSVMFLRSPSLSDAFGGARGAQNFTAFLENSKRGSPQTSDLPTLSGDDGLDIFATKTHEDWLLLDQLTLFWIEELLCPRISTTTDGTDMPSAYERFVWTSALKETVVQLLVQKDGYIFTTLRRRVQELDERLLIALRQQKSIPWTNQHEMLAKLIQHTFELHIDVYERITNPSSEVDPDIRSMQRDRLARWAALAHQTVCLRPKDGDEPDELQIRFLWSTVLFVHSTEASAREHIILCFQDLKQILSATETRSVKLQNNAAMPEISIEAADREISCLTTMDFFLGIFHSENNEPMSIIESLEPMLQRSIVKTITDVTPKATSDQSNETLVDGDSQSVDSTSNGEDIDLPDPTAEDMVQYFNNASLTLRLFLWQRLGSAYEAIDYLPQVLSCNLRRIELIVEHLQTADYVDQPSQARQLSLLRWMKELEHLVITTLSMAINNRDAFEVVDLAQLRSATASVSAFQRVIHVYILWTDSVRVGQTTILQPPRGSAATQFAQSMAKFDQLQVQAWMLQFMLLKEAIVQAPELYEAPHDDLIDYLNLVHYTLGLRELCGLCNRIFLKVMKMEMLAYRASNKVSETWEWDFAQVIFDLYGLKICPSFFKIGSHGCTGENVDRATALELMDYVLTQAYKLGVKDVAKSELKLTIDKMQAAIRAPKPSNITTFNKRAIAHFLRSPINPLDMYHALKGLGELTSLPINNDFTVVANKGWYSLLGHMSLVKFRSHKRLIPGPLDDLDIAMTFFKHDLELGMEKWETWYRLAQVYDTKIEESTTWTAEKINHGMEELKLLQRSAIHCYTMAVATAMRSADASFEAVGKMADLHVDFAVRIYASSREPFSMKAFGLQDFERHFSDPQEGMYMKRPFRDLQLYPAWNFARVLLQRALTDKPNSWIWSMLGKCLWKMYNCSSEVRGNAVRPSSAKILHALKRAITAVPDRRDSRHPDKEPILEPHYKLVSIVHKLVQKGALQVSDACSCLKATSYAQKVPPVENREDWKMYISQVLKTLRSADKSNWHHRMVARAAHVIYDDSPDDIRSAQGARNELTQQMFTKTMAIQVWRPDNERAGRHFVYKTRYVKFFVRLLFQLSDKASLEALAKRIRKRSGELLAHAEIWQEVCITYLELLRRQGPVPNQDENTLFNGTTHDVFTVNADRLEAHLSDTTLLLLDIIKDTIELKKTNQNLMKVSTIEDLIVDTYAMLYEQTVPELIAKSNNEESRVRMRVDHVLMAPGDSATATPPPDPNAKPGDAPATKPRLKSVTRREVIRRAEALVAKPAAAGAAADVKLSKPAEQATEQEGTMRMAAVIHKDDVSKDAGSSAPGSVHDSADDESELSDPEEFVDAPEKPASLFPDLSTKDGEGGGDTEVDEGEGDNEDRQNEKVRAEEEEAPTGKEKNKNGFQSVIQRNKKLTDGETAEPQSMEE